ncbi:MAG: SipW-dependent-type signal peptide-containing protein [Firmicutes bacterium]|nr:SipW-dependent-type signal peptide-containing protein [Dethiobacter sp.]MBS3888214.1 SipW-dependent-type signal peptide-containing protein [Bacillota bacterium]MBS4053587.1 SipW-dependent-type signal peptide-containing protein [Thermaerobacter sp.]
MKTKMIVSMLILALAAALVGGATMAIFTDTENNNGNTFTAGTVNITVGGTSMPAVAAGNMAPGDTITGSFTVTNAGTLQLRFDVSGALGGALFSGATPAILAGLGDDQDVVLDPGASAVVTFTVHLPLGAGNAYQNATGTIDFTIVAEQTANN